MSDGTTQEKKTSHLVPLEEMIIRSSTEPPIPGIWSGIKVGTFGFIFGPSKAGKTTFCENLAISIATGQPTFFGKSLIEGGQKVLFISMEEYWQPRTERNARQVGHLNVPLNNNFISVDEHFPRILGGEEDWKLLEKHIKESEAQIVFIDSLSRMYSGSIEESGLAKKLLFQLRELKDALKITLIVIHHTPKQMGRPLTIDSLAGSRMLAQEADFMIGVSKSPDGTRYMKEVAYRYAQENDETVFAFTISDNSWLLPTIEVSEAALLKESDGRNDDTNTGLILDFIEAKTEAKELVKTNDLMEEFVKSKVMSKPTLFSSLSKLESKGKIAKPQKGQYQSKGN